MLLAQELNGAKLECEGLQRLVAEQKKMIDVDAQLLAEENQVMQALERYQELQE